MGLGVSHFVKFYNGMPVYASLRHNDDFDPNKPIRILEVNKGIDPLQYLAEVARLEVVPGIINKSWACLYSVTTTMKKMKIDNKWEDMIVAEEPVFIRCFINAGTNLILSPTEPDIIYV